MDCAGSAVAHDRFGDHAPGDDERSVINGIYCEPFHVEHADRIRVEGTDADYYRFYHQPPELIRQAATCGPFYTGWAGDEILTIAGVCLMWPGVGEAAVYVSHLAPKYPVALTKIIGHYLERIIENHQLHRVQCVVLENFKRSAAWVRLLGFHEEGRLEQYGPGRENFIRFARIIER